MENNANVKNRVCLVVIDGWGLSEEQKGNAILNAKTPVMDKLCSNNWTQIEGLMGNSEVGHLNIGAGRVIYQDIVRINMAVSSGMLNTNATIIDAANRVIANNGRLHLLGLVSDGGVHSHIEHLFGLIKAFKSLGVPLLFIHFFGDGRDTSPTSGVTYLKKLQDFLIGENYGELATIVGRYYAMDRDKRWERIQVAYDALVGCLGENSEASEAISVVKSRYSNNETDEFLKPIVFSKDSRIKDNDTLLFFNYRADRMREINECFGMEGHHKYLKSAFQQPSNIKLYSMTQYNKEFPFPVLFPPISHVNVLAEWLSVQKVSQFHCAETEKYAHVTFFFNGGRETQFEGEERCMVPSPKVATYDLMPEMSAAGVADKMVEHIISKKHPFLMCNFAPPDMVGHTGQYEPAVRACEATDIAIGRIYDACIEHGYILMVTADHGNAEKMIAPDGVVAHLAYVLLSFIGSMHTAHTCYRVPFTCSSSTFKFKNSIDRPFALRDVAPTALHILGLPIPKEMDGVSIVDEL